LNVDEPAIAPAPPTALDAELAALLAGVLAGVDELLFDGEEQAARASAPEAMARPAAIIFLFIHNLLFHVGSARNG
jgi:hypothetical protein